MSASTLRNKSVELSLGDSLQIGAGLIIVKLIRDPRRDPSYEFYADIRASANVHIKDFPGQLEPLSLGWMLEIDRSITSLAAALLPLKDDSPVHFVVPVDIVVIGSEAPAPYPSLIKCMTSMGEVFIKFIAIDKDGTWHLQVTTPKGLSLQVIQEDGGTS